MGGETDFGWTHNVPHRRFKIYWFVSYVVRLQFVAAIVTHWIDVVEAICFLQEFWICLVVEIDCGEISAELVVAKNNAKKNGYLVCLPPGHLGSVVDDLFIWGEDVIDR